MSASATLADLARPRADPGVATAYRPLGAFRFSLALLVVARHFQNLLVQPTPFLLARSAPGIVAVTVFFVVSGFVVAEACIVFYAQRPFAFLANRVLRVVPGYLAALIVAVAVQAGLWRAGHLVLADYTLAGSPLDLRLIAAGLCGVIPGFHGRMLGSTEFEFIPFAWSLRVEMAFYLAACMLLVAAKHAGGRLAGWTLGVALAGCGMFLLMGRTGLLGSGPMFLFGVAISLLQRRRSLVRWAYGAGCFVFTLVGFASFRQHGAPLMWLQLPLLVGLLAVLAGLVMTQAGSWQRWDKALGALSYPLYLNHYAVGILLANEVAYRGIWLFLVATAAAIGLSWLMGEAVERPLRRWRASIRGAVL